MIVRNLTLKVQGNRTCTDSPIYLYQYDKNIHLIITLNNVKYEVTNDMFVSYTIVKPNSEVLTKTNCFIKNGKVHLILESNLFDGDEEVGTALCQLKLYDKELESSVALPPFAIHVLDGYKQTIEEFEEGVVVLMTQNELKLLSENEQALRVMDGGTKGSIKISELEPTIEATGMIPVVQNDKTMRYNLDGLATKQFVRESLNETLNEVTEQMDVVNQMAVSIEGKADETDLEQIRQDLAEHTHEELATKSELNAKADAEHEHSQYLTEHQDLSSYALRTEIPSTDGLATKEYVDSAVSGKIEDGSSYATKQELENAIVGHFHNEYADVNHVHSQYLTKHQDISHLATKSEIPSLNGYATETYVNDAIANIDLSGAGGSGNGLDVRVIGDGVSVHTFTGEEFTEDEYLNGSIFTVLFKNVELKYAGGSLTLANEIAQVILKREYDDEHYTTSSVTIETINKHYKLDIEIDKNYNNNKYTYLRENHARVLENQLSTYATTKSVDDKLKNKAHINHTHDISKKDATSLMELKYFYQYFNYGTTYFTVDNFYPNAGEEYSIVLPSEDMMNMFLNGSGYSSMYEAHIFIDASHIPTNTSIGAKRIRTMDESTGEPTEFESDNIVWEETETTNLKAGDNCTLEIVLTYYGYRSMWLVKAHKYQWRVF